MGKLNYVQISKEDNAVCEVATKLCFPYFEELNEHERVVESKEEILEAVKQRIAIQGKREDMHFEIALLNDEAIGIAMFAIDLGTVRGLLECGYGTVLEFYIRPEYRRMGLGEEFYRHIEEVLCADGAKSFYVTPDAVTGIPFWTSMGFVDTGLMDPDNQQPIYIKCISK